MVNCLCMFGMFASNRRMCLHCWCCSRSIMERRSNYNDENDRPLNVNHVQRQSDMPSLHTISDFPRPANMNGVDSEEEAVSRSPKTPSSVMSDIALNRYQDAVEKNNFVLQENGVNYMQYLNGGCWYYKSRLFWTWMSYYFCFCGSGSMYNCYICLCNVAACKKRVKRNRKVMRYMFGAAKKIQYQRHMERMMDQDLLPASAVKSTRSTGSIKVSEIQRTDNEESKDIPNPTGAFTKQITDFDPNE